MNNLFIVIINYKTPALLRQCLDSILKNNPGMEKRILVIDNFSQDESFAMMQKALDMDKRVALPITVVEGKNLVIEWRWAEGKVERLPELATELVQSKVDVLVSSDTPTAQALHKATTTIPIVAANVTDPIGAGLVKSLARPDGNITGLTNLGADMVAKRLEMLVSVVPTKLSRVAYLMDPSTLGNIQGLEAVQAAAPKLGVNILRADARTPQEIVDVFSLMTKHKTQAIVVAMNSLFLRQLRQIAELAAKNGLPSIQPTGAYAEAGGLIGYGTSVSDQFRRAATYVDKILKGAKPADLPVEQPTKFELIINAKTAKALGLKIPQSLLVMADKVIE